MKRMLFLLLLSCLATAQKNKDTSKDEALLNDLLNTTPIESEQAAPAQEAQEPSESTAPAETFEPVESSGTSRSVSPEYQSERSSPELESRPVQKQRTGRSRSRETTSSSSASADLPSPDEAKVQETPDIPNFSHKAHIEDVGAECVQCHQTLFSESVRGIKSGPSMKEICSQCHNGDVAPSEAIAGFSNEKKYVKTHMPLFSHTKHIQNTERCNTCHTDIYGDLKKIAMPPPMTRCTVCHNDHTANSSCNVCHENPNKLKPKSHTSIWVYRNGHGKDARLNQNECRECHAERDCNACHRGQSTFQVHRPGYKYSHGMDVRQRVANCGYCHDPQFSCTRCHERKQ
jgi:predicted CXXCH cytochrome family protein